MTLNTCMAVTPSVPVELLPEGPRGEVLVEVNINSRRSCSVIGHNLNIKPRASPASAGHPPRQVLLVLAVFLLLPLLAPYLHRPIAGVSCSFCCCCCYCCYCFSCCSYCCLSHPPLFAYPLAASIPACPPAYRPRSAPHELSAPPTTTRHLLPPPPLPQHRRVPQEWPVTRNKQSGYRSVHSYVILRRIIFAHAHGVSRIQKLRVKYSGLRTSKTGTNDIRGKNILSCQDLEYCLFSCYCRHAYRHGRGPTRPDWHRGLLVRETIHGAKSRSQRELRVESFQGSDCSTSSTANTHKLAMVYVFRVSKPTSSSSCLSLSVLGAFDPPSTNIGVISSSASASLLTVWNSPPRSTSFDGEAIIASTLTAPSC